MPTHPKKAELLRLVIRWHHPLRHAHAVLRRAAGNVLNIVTAVSTVNELLVDGHVLVFRHDGRVELDFVLVKKGLVDICANVEQGISHAHEEA